MSSLASLKFLTFHFSHLGEKKRGRRGRKKIRVFPSFSLGSFDDNLKEEIMVLGGPGLFRYYFVCGEIEVKWVHCVWGD